MEDCPDDPEDGESCVETESNCSYEETAAKIEMVLRRNLRLDMVDANDDKQLTRPTVDVKSLPGYQAIPTNCPLWKRAMIEKKNRQLEADAMRELMAKREESDRWKNVPEWKKQLILEREKKKQQEMAEIRHRRDVESERLKALPEWKRHLLIKRREHDAA